jgi:hypothetical protein
MNIATSLAELSEKRKQIEKAAQEQAKAILAPGLQQFMTEHPDVKAIGWTQYTPYFNDGEPCVFGVNDLHASAVDERDDEVGGDGWEYLYGKSEKGFTRQSWDDLLALQKALNGAEPELQAAFGDHVRVIVTREGIDVEEYSHD